MPETAPTLTSWEIVLRLVVAAIFGGLVGFERELSDQPAGFRTHILVSIGAALFTIVGAFALEGFGGNGSLRVTLDPTRVAAQVVTGIGFLGAGAILRQGLSVRGLTTAAALWVTAAIGTAVGLGYWVGGGAAAVVTVAALFGLKRIEGMMFPRFKRNRQRFLIEVGKGLRLSELSDALEAAGTRAESLKMATGEQGHRHLIADLHLPPGVSSEELAEAVTRIEGVKSVEVSS